MTTCLSWLINVDDEDGCILLRGQHDVLAAGKRWRVNPVKPRTSRPVAIRVVRAREVAVFAGMDRTATEMR
ncbi:hypothetical protein ACXIUA_07015 [Corynebacterium sp. UMB8791]